MLPFKKSSTADRVSLLTSYPNTMTQWIESPLKEMFSDNCRTDVMEADLGNYDGYYTVAGETFKDVCERQSLNPRTARQRKNQPHWAHSREALIEKLAALVSGTS